MAEQPSQNNRDDVTSSQEEAEKGKGTVDGQSKPDEENQDLDSFLATFQEDGTDGENQEESEDDQELSQMISLMESQAPELAPPETPKTEGTVEGEASDPILEEEEKEGESNAEVGSEDQVPDVTTETEETGDEAVIETTADDPVSVQVDTQEAEADLIAEEKTGEKPDEPLDAPVEPESGETLNDLVNDRSREDVLDAFGVEDERVAQNLNRESIVNYLTGKGFNIRGKDAYELSPREIFEVLSMREIKTREGIISILSLLIEKVSASREDQAAKWEKIRPSHLAIRSKPSTIDSPENSSVVWAGMGTSIQRVHGPGFMRKSLQNEITSRGPGLVC